MQFTNFLFNSKLELTSFIDLFIDSFHNPIILFPSFLNDSFTYMLVYFSFKPLYVHLSFFSSLLTILSFISLRILDIPKIILMLFLYHYTHFILYEINFIPYLFFVHFLSLYTLFMHLELWFLDLLQMAFCGKNNFVGKFSYFLCNNLFFTGPHIGFSKLIFFQSYWDIINIVIVMSVFNQILALEMASWSYSSWNPFSFSQPIPESWFWSFSM